MIVDVHTHLPTHQNKVPESEMVTEEMMRSGKSVNLTNSLDDYMKEMEVVDKAILFGIAPRPGKENMGELFGAGKGWDTKLNHNDVASIISKKFPEKIVPFMSLHPKDPDWNLEYDRCLGDLGIKGIKLGPNYQDFDPNSPESYKLFSRLQDDNIPVIFHQGTSPMADAPLSFSHPLTTDKVAIAFPKLKIILAHLGHPWQTDCLAVVRKHKNVWADVSAQFHRPYSFWLGMRLFYEWACTQKILFASDWPVTNPSESISGLRNLPKFARDHNLPEIPEEEIEHIINRDSLSILEIS